MYYPPFSERHNKSVVLLESDQFFFFFHFLFHSDKLGIELGTSYMHILCYWVISLVPEFTFDIFRLLILHKDSSGYIIVTLEKEIPHLEKQEQKGTIMLDFFVCMSYMSCNFSSFNHQCPCAYLESSIGFKTTICDGQGISLDFGMSYWNSK